MIDKEKVLSYLQDKIDYVNSVVITDGVHVVPINSQIIDLLNSIVDYVNSLD